MLSRIKRWWQLRTGQTDTPFDGESPYWIVSLLVHMAVLIFLAKMLVPVEEKVEEFEVVSELQEVEEFEEPGRRICARRIHNIGRTD